MASPVEVAWAAGVFEGEGSIGLANRGETRSPTPVLRMNMTDRDVLERFYAIVGFGKVYGPYQYGTAKRKPMFCWQSGGWFYARALFDAFAEHLGERRTARFGEVLAQEPTVRKCLVPAYSYEHNGRTIEVSEHVRYDRREPRVRRGPAVGERNANAKLTAAKVRRIRERHAAGAPVRFLAEEAGVTPQAIRNILARRTWREI